MKANRKTVIAVAALGVAGVLIAVVMRDEMGERVTPINHRVTSPSVSAAAAAPSPQQTAVVAAAVRPVGAAEPSAKLRADFLHAKDWRAFALNAMDRPAEGGYFYARYVIDLCGMKMAELKDIAREAQSKQLAKNGTIDGAQQQAVDAAFNRCDTFISDETAKLLAEVRRRERDGTDPLVNAQNDALTAFRSGDSRALSAAAERTFDLADPLLISRSDLLRGFASRGPTAVAKQGIVFGGQLVLPDHAQEYANVAWALELGACKESAPCSWEDLQKVACAVAGKCYSDQRAYLEAQLATVGRPPEDAKKILVMADQVRQAVAAKDVAFFVR